jgi:pullulanase/glycogen debranching enzyme
MPAQFAAPTRNPYRRPRRLNAYLIKALLQLRTRHPELQAAAYVPAGARPLPSAGLTCYGTNGAPLTDSDLDAPEQHALTVMFDSPKGAEPQLSLLLNAYDQPLPFTIPENPAGTWNALVDTRAAFGEQLVTARIAAAEAFELAERSAVVLER